MLVVSVASGGAWIGGSGKFTTSNVLLNAVYTPTATEIANGTLVLTLNTTGYGNCLPVSSNVKITFTKPSLAPAALALASVAKASRTATAYDYYLSAEIQLRALLAKWEAEDLVFGQITELLDAFYTEQEMQTNPARLLVKRLHPGTYRIEPGFSLVIKELPDDLKATYLARGQAEMQAFTSYLKRQWQRSRNKEEKP